MNKSIDRSLSILVAFALVIVNFYNVSAASISGSRATVNRDFPSTTVDAWSTGNTQFDKNYFTSPNAVTSESSAIISTSAANDEIHWTITGPNSITLDWRGPSNTVSYGITTAYGATVTASAPSPKPFSSVGPFWEAKLVNLQLNTIYHYSIGGETDHTFKTALPKGSSNFTVDVIGDVGDTSSYKNVGPIQAMIAADQPSLALMVGDLTYGNVNGQPAVDQHFNDVQAWTLGNTAYMPAWGNHEWDDPTNDNLKNYKGRFDFPNPQTSPGSPAVSCCGEDWYYFDYGNVRFIAYPEPFSGAWSDWNTHANVLMDEAQADPTITFIITFGHRPAYSSGYHSGDTTLQSYLNALGASHSKYVLNLNGHSHNYERTFPQSNVVHITAGTGGADLEQVGTCLWGICTQPSWSAKRYMHLGVVRLRFIANTIQGEFVCGPAGSGTNDINCTQGNVIDNFTIRAGTKHFAANEEGAYTDTEAVGFNIHDTGMSTSTINALPTGSQAMVWVGVGSSNCSATLAPAFTSFVLANATNPKLYGFYLTDEPLDNTCVAAVTAYTNYIHANAPGKKAFILLTDWPGTYAAYRPDVTNVDLIGLDPYPVKDGTYDNTLISRQVNNAIAAGIPLANIVPVFQTFGGAGWDAPTASQLIAILNQWAALVPNPPLDYAYSWGTQSNYLSDALVNRADWRTIMASHNQAPGVSALPVVTSIVRASPNPTMSATNVNFTVKFSEAVTGVDTIAPFSDFTLTTTGVLSGAAITGVSGSGNSYTVTVNTGSGNGTIRLDVTDDDSIVDMANIPLGGVGVGNGDFTTGETYTIDTRSLTGNAGIGGAVLSYSNSAPKTVLADGNGNYIITVPVGWSGIVTPYKTGYSFTPMTRSYSKVQSNQTAQDYTAQVCVNCADVNVSIGAAQAGNYTILPAPSLLERYSSMMGGPVKVMSTNSKNIITSQRAIYGNSFNELMGYPSDQFVTEYWFPWYDQVNMQTWILVGNPSTTQHAYVDIYIGGVKRADDKGLIRTYDIPPGGNVTPQFPRVVNGPVRVVSVTGNGTPSPINIFTSERSIYASSFNEVMGYPFNKFVKEYWFPWYDQVNMGTWILVGNPSTTQHAYVDIYIGGVKVNDTPDGLPYAIPANGRITPQFPGIVNGPVRVVSVTGSGTPSPINIFTSERSIYASSFNEVMGTPLNQFTTEYWYPWYDNVSMSTWILVGNPSDTQTAYVDIYIGGVKVNDTPGGAPYVIPVNGRITPTFPTKNGPVRVVSVTGDGTPSPIDVFTSERVIYKSSFNEMMGYPANQLTSEYWFTWYDNVYMQSDIYIGKP